MHSVDDDVDVDEWILVLFMAELCLYLVSDVGDCQDGHPIPRLYSL